MAKNERFQAVRGFGGCRLVLLALLVVGCGGRVPLLAPQPTVAQVEAEVQKSRFQDQVMQGMAKPAPTAFRDYQVGPEDLLEVTFFGHNELYREVRVNGQGEISVPLVGNVQVAGLSPQQVEKRLADLYKERRFLKNPQITVFVKEYRHQRVAVTGAVNRPDYYEVIGPRTLLEMLGMAGGLKENAADVVHIIRRPSRGATAAAKPGAVQSFTPGTETIVVDLNRLVRQGAADLNLPISSGDVVHVPFAQNAYVLGAVNKPGNVAVKDKMTAAQAVAMAGGLKPELASNRASVIRFDDSGQRVVLPVNLWRVTRASEEDIPLKPNDIVFVHESPFRRVLFDIKSLNPGMFSMGLAP
ncbi:MAG: hypothetical protein FJ128_08545 [Deltaproteobacteria bacterium]|nr:hypothetical protein [Deltaproteobacteria bacterium]